ncbi:MAG TPA: hypothetical protein VFO85_02420 [Vicinamibacteria bacterium]|nr:hypothetical protein [Vicinamibacteria bacterium]
MSGPLAATHLEEEDLILHYYGETGAAAEAHLAECAACGAAYGDLCAALDAVTDATAAGEGPALLAPAAVDAAWLRLRPRLLASRPAGWRRMLAAPLAAAAALVFAFLAGRQWPLPSPSTSPSPAASAPVRERVLLVAVGDHLQRSQMLLVELANAPAGRPVHIAAEQEWAEELVGANRLYRQGAEAAGEPAVAGLLEELERVLVEIAHAPPDLPADQLARIQRRIESRGLLFKVQVLEKRVRTQRPREAPPAGAIS